MERKMGRRRMERERGRVEREREKGNPSIVLYYYFLEGCHPGRRRARGRWQRRAIVGTGSQSSNSGGSDVGISVGTRETVTTEDEEPLKKQVDIFRKGVDSRR